VDTEQVTRAVANMDPEERSRFVRELLDGLRNEGIDPGAVAGDLGIRSGEPEQMEPQDVGRVADYAQQNKPGLLQKVADAQPGLVKALGSPVVQGILAAMAAAYIGKRTNSLPTHL
jgi:hypothetical protein